MILNRREFLSRAALGAAALRLDPAQDARTLEPSLTLISGKPVERGRAYGRIFRDGLHAFLEKEIYASFTGKPNLRESLLRFAGACAKSIQAYSPLLREELEGIAEGAGLRLEEVVLVTSHEELYHRGVVPAVDHCTVFGAAPPDTKDGDTFVCQTWDWMESVYGLSSMLHWKRTEGPSVLAYSFPGLWTGAGLNERGLALCWHTLMAGTKEPQVGIPAYVLIAQALYQDTLKGALEELRRAPVAGWFSFLIGDAQGAFATVRGTPGKLEIVEGARANGGRILAEGEAKVDLARLQAQCGKVKVKTTIDSMIFNCRTREAHVTRRAGGVIPWKRFGFEELK